jgi:hypothetical protein
VSNITEQEKDIDGSMIAEISEHTSLREISDEEYNAALTLLSMSDGVSDQETAETMLKLSSGMGGGRAQRGGANSKVVHFISILCIAATAGISLKIAFYIAGKFGLFAVAERAMVIAEAQIKSCGSLAEGLGQHETHKYVGKLAGNNLDHIIPSCSKAWENLETAREALGTTTAQFTERLLGAGVLISFAGYNQVYAAVDSLLDFCFIENTQAVTEGAEERESKGSNPGGGRKRTKSRRKSKGKKHQTRLSSRRRRKGKRTKTRKKRRGGATIRKRKKSK